VCCDPGSEVPARLIFPARAGISPAAVHPPPCQPIIPLEVLLIDKELYAEWKNKIQFGKIQYAIYIYSGRLSFQKQFLEPIIKFMSMKIKELVVVLIGFILIMPVYMSSCQEDEDVPARDTIVDVDTLYSTDTLYRTEKPVFMMEFEVYRMRGDTDLISMRFVTNEVSTIPSIQLNDTTVKHFYTNGPLLRAYAEIPYSRTIDYSLVRNDSSISGQFIMPEPDTPKVSGFPLVVQPEATWSPPSLPEEDAFSASWNFPDADQVVLNMYRSSPWMPQQKDTLNTRSYSMTIDTSDVPNKDETWEEEISEGVYGNIEGYRLELSNLQVIGRKGFDFTVPGKTPEPNVEGDFGKGFVESRFIYNNPNVYMGTDTLNTYQKSGYSGLKDPPFLRGSINQSPQEKMEKLEETFKGLILELKNR
jgi:hypothetical protein